MNESDLTKLSEPSQETPARWKLRDLALERARYEYEELADNWKQLDTKAQATAAIAGIFLAATFAFSYHLPSSTANPLLIGGLRFFGIGLVLCLTTSICLAVLAMLVRDVFMPPCSADAWKRIKPILANDVEPRFQEFEYHRTLTEFVEEWVEANTSLNEKNSLKAAKVQLAQKVLLVGAIAGAILAVGRFLI